MNTTIKPLASTLYILLTAKRRGSGMHQSKIGEHICSARSKQQRFNKGDN